MLNRMIKISPIRALASQTIHYGFAQHVSQLAINGE
jgi:hypothetical protein